MKLNELDASARRIGPIKAVLADGTPVVDFSAAGAVKVSVNDGPLVAALGAVVVIGSGYVYYQATAADASVRGFISVRLADVCLEQTFREEVEPFPQGIPVGTADASLLHVGPLRAVDGSGVPVLLGTGIVTQVSLNGAAWAAPAGALTEISNGYYDYPPSIGEVVTRGWIAVKLTGSCQEFVLRATIVDETTLGVAPPAPPAVPPMPGVSVAIADRIAGDLAIVWSNATGDADLLRLIESASGLATDLATDRGLVTAVVLSLFTDRRAEPDDAPPSGDPRDRRGWWGDQFATTQGDLVGSRLWLLTRAKQGNETVMRAKEYVREALAWMLEDRVVSAVDVDAVADRKALLIDVGLQRPGRDPVSFRFAHAWDTLQESN